MKKFLGGLKKVGSGGSKCTDIRAARSDLWDLLKSGKADALLTGGSGDGHGHGQSTPAARPGVTAEGRAEFLRRVAAAGGPAVRRDVPDPVWEYGWSLLHYAAAGDW